MMETVSNSAIKPEGGYRCRVVYEDKNYYSILRKDIVKVVRL